MERGWLDKFGRVWTGPYPFTEAGVKQAEAEAVGGTYGTFFSAKGKLAPKTAAFSGIYQIIENNVILYVDKAVADPSYIGISSNSVFARLRKHVRGAGNKPTGDAAKKGTYSFVYWLCDHESAKQIESNITSDNRPAFNQKIEWLNYIANITIH